MAVSTVYRTAPLLGLDLALTECTAVIEARQNDGALTRSFPPDVMNFLLLAVAGYWAALPQVARMITDTNANEADETARRRAGVVEAARRLTATDATDSLNPTEEC
jgi:hypothetical protein